MAAELEEIVVDAYRRKSEAMLPNRLELPLQAFRMLRNHAHRFAQRRVLGQSV